MSDIYERAKMLVGLPCFPRYSIRLAEEVERLAREDERAKVNAAFSLEEVRIRSDEQAKVSDYWHDVS
jgi:hypothetical protein